MYKYIMYDMPNVMTKCKNPIKEKYVFSLNRLEKKEISV